MLENINNEMLPNALMIGVDYELFWTLNPKSLQPFIKAFDLKLEYDDLLAWKQGVYMKQAITSSFSKDGKYPAEPYTVLEKKRRERSTPKYIKSMVEAKAEVINMRFENEG